MSAAPDIAFSIVLVLAAALSILVSIRTRRAARDYLQFAAALCAALAIADFIAAAENEIWSTQLADTIVLIVAALAPAMLTLSIAAVFERPIKTIIAAPILVLAFVAALAAAFSGETFVALAPLAVSVCAMLALAARRWRLYARAPAQATLSALALLAAAAAFSAGGRTAFALFLAAALLGTALATTRPSYRTVEEKRRQLELHVRRQS